VCVQDKDSRLEQALDERERLETAFTGAHTARSHPPSPPAPSPHPPLQTKSSMAIAHLARRPRQIQSGAPFRSPVPSSLVVIATTPILFLLALAATSPASTLVRAQLSSGSNSSSTAYVGCPAGAYTRSFISST
jgi:hypothetical protein